MTLGLSNLNNTQYLLPNFYTAKALLQPSHTYWVSHWMEKLGIDTYKAHVVRKADIGSECGNIYVDPFNDAGGVFFGFTPL